MSAEEGTRGFTSGLVFWRRTVELGCVIDGESQGLFVGQFTISRSFLRIRVMIQVIRIQLALPETRTLNLTLTPTHLT